MHILKSQLPGGTYRFRVSLTFQMTPLYGRVEVRILVTKPDGMDVSVVL